MELKLELPGGHVESIVVDPTRAGMAVLSKMLPLKRKYNLPEDMHIFRPDGLPLAMGKPLDSQGLQFGDLLCVGEVRSEATRVTPTGEEVKIVEYTVGAEKRDEVPTSPPEPSPAAKLSLAGALARKAEEQLQGGISPAQAVLAFSEVLEALGPVGIAVKDGEGEFDELEVERRALAVRALFGRSRAHLRQQRWPEALRDAESCLGLKPEDVDAMCCQGLALKQLGRAEKARACLGWVLLKIPNHKIARNALAAIRVETKPAAGYAK